MPTETAGLNFEAAYTELAEIVSRLNDGDLPLEHAVALFERGRALAAHCQRLLDDAELRLTQLPGE